MKECPRCGAKAFEDATVCYGCLYQFTIQNATREDDSLTKHSREETGISYERESRIGSQMVMRGDAMEPEAPPNSLHVPINQEPPEFCIHLIPRHSEWGGWKWDCSVEIAEKVKHEVVGRHALRVH